MYLRKVIILKNKPIKNVLDSPRKHIFFMPRKDLITFVVNVYIRTKRCDMIFL